MSKFDIESLFSEVSAESPCGEDISYDQDYLALERLLQPKGGGVIAAEEEAAEEPNWSEVADKSFDLLRRSKDLRVVMYFTVALLKLEGFAGLRDGLLLLRGLLERFWDNMYPQLDPEDNNDPLERINILSSLSPPPGSVSAQDPMKFKQRAMEVPLCDSRQMGRFSFRDIQVAKGAITVPEEQRAQVPEMSVIDAAFRDSEIEKLQSSFEAIGSAIEHASAAMEVFSERAYQSQSPDFSDFVTLLKNIRKFLQEHLGGGVEGAVGEAVVPAAGGRGGVQVPGSIQSPQDAMKVLDKVCEYFERHEPSSPVPLLLRRAKKLISKNFLEIIENMCPGAMSEVETVSGASKDSETG